MGAWSLGGDDWSDPQEEGECPEQGCSSYSIAELVVRMKDCSRGTQGDMQSKISIFLKGVAYGLSGGNCKSFVLG